MSWVQFTIRAKLDGLTDDERGEQYGSVREFVQALEVMVGHTPYNVSVEEQVDLSDHGGQGPSPAPEGGSHAA